jgi:hypothetical protein
MRRPPTHSSLQTPRSSYARLSSVRRPVQILLRLAIAVSALIIALQLGLIPKLARSLAGWAAWPPQSPDTTPLWPGLDEALRAAYTTLSLGQPLTPWIVWLASAAALLALAPRRRKRRPAPPPPPRRVTPRGALIALALLAVTGVAAVTRAANLLPDPDGVWPASNFDEQVYYTNARLLAQGELPYRDHFLAHPPGAAYLLAPGQAAQALWGGPGAFGAARQWVLLFSLLAIPLIFLVGRKLGGPGAGLLAAGALALDGRVAQVAVLETLVNCASLAALLLYLYIPRQLRWRQRAVWIALCGACCALACLTKIPGLAIGLALPAHALYVRRPRVAAGIVASAIGAGLLGLAPFLVVAPGALLRQVIFFQLLRPQEVKPGLDESIRIADYPTSLLTMALAAAGALLLTAAILRGATAGRRSAALRRWLVVPLWATPVLAVFVFGRSFHAPYYAQWAPPLALLAGACAAQPVWRALAPRRPTRRVIAAFAVPVVGLLALPLFGRVWATTLDVAPDTVYRPAGATLRAYTGAKDTVLSFDPGYAYVAGRPLTVVPGGGRLVDSAGYMTYYGLGIDHRSWGDLLDAALHFNKERNAPAVFQSAPAQASVIAGFWNSAVVVVDGKIGLPQLRGQTLALLGQMAPSTQQVEHVTLYAMSPGAAAAHGFGPLNLRALTFQPLAADGSATGTTLLRQDAESDVVQIAPGQVLQLGCYWQAAPGAGAVRVVAQLVGPAGPVALSDSAPDEGRAQTDLWNPAFVYPDLRNLAVPAGAPPGDYRLLLGVGPAGSAPTLVAVPIQIVVGPGG